MWADPFWSREADTVNGTRTTALPGGSSSKVGRGPDRADPGTTVEWSDVWVDRLRVSLPPTPVVPGEGKDLGARIRGFRTPRVGSGISFPLVGCGSRRPRNTLTGPL